MVTIRHSDRDGRIRVTLCGHAGTAPSGDDLVCAGVSALTLTLADALKRANAPALHTDIEAGHARIECRADRHTRGIVRTILCGYRLLADAFDTAVELIKE